MTEQTAPRVTASALILFSFFVLIYAFLPIVLAGRWAWWQGWSYAIVMVLSALASRLLAARRHPDLLAERGRFTNVPDAKPWDRKLVPFVGLIGPFTMLLVTGLDARFGWSPPLPAWSAAGALVVILLATFVSGWALVENRFFSGMVRIQSERGHHVVDSGPYRFVRHPGYAGAVWTFLATPILLGSLWGLLPALATTILLIVRTSLEDRTLQAELPGYREFTHTTRYRLFPGVW